VTLPVQRRHHAIHLVFGGEASTVKNRAKKLICIQNHSKHQENYVPREEVEAINDFELYEYFRKTETLSKEHNDSIKDVIDGIVFRERVKQIPEVEASKQAHSQSLTRLQHFAQIFWQQSLHKNVEASAAFSRPRNLRFRIY